MSQARLTVTCGLPGSGKSTWASVQGETVLTLDSIRTAGASSSAVGAKAYATARNKLKAGRSVVIDVCALTSAERRSWLALARTLGVQTRLVFFETSPEVCRARDVARGAQASGLEPQRALAQLSAARSAVLSEGWGAIERVR